ncbi:MAG: DUF2089 family protein, partial [Oscillospiraceae bacterium]|nr:DUF2089 family protein [Oscillospiraceae bacterium]
NRPFLKCPACQGALHISALRCPDCDLELKNAFRFSEFDCLGEEQLQFLIAFLQCRGNLKDLQEKLHISYFLARKKLDDLLVELNLAEKEEKALGEEMEDMAKWFTKPDSNKASEIVKRKLKENGGRAIVYTARGLPCEIRVAADGKSFLCDKLPIKPPYEFRVFDIIVDLLLANGGKARKGSGRNAKLGESDCDETTVVGYIGKHYAGKAIGASVYDPVFALAAIMEWAGIVTNGRGELLLTASYMAKR